MGKRTGRERCGGRGLLGWLLGAVIVGVALSRFLPIGGPRAPVPNIVLVSIDTLRADQLGCYGSRGGETPNLDRLAERGVVFERCFAQGTYTFPSDAALFTGRYPEAIPIASTGIHPLPVTHRTFVELLTGGGYETAAFTGGGLIGKRFGFHRGFEFIHGYDVHPPNPGERTNLWGRKQDGSASVK